MEHADYSKVFSESVKIIDECFTRYDLNEIFVAFNGGKDCTVLLDIIVNTLSASKRDLKSLSVVYIQPDNPFAELEDFIFNIKDQYGINLTVVPGNIKLALENTLKVNEDIKACLMGTRRSDPHSEHLNFFHMTDPSWPQIMRVSPILNWSYREVWSYLIDKQVPYCKLYDLGYTSLGSTTNTIPNPALRVVDSSSDTITFKPAYYLKDGSLERNGRDIK
ncbi:flavin adenine dinucleotide synthetase 2 [Arctopsyche grandis]|uniref:flavin adenine dinucleotide synthetase 2 n=1 Tax=Arctopsyche grandis TaxID=121162 RepID=UPI00406D6BE7